MGELKEHLFVPNSELQEGDELTDAFTIAKSYYLKAEADEVIKKLNERVSEERSAKVNYKISANDLSDGLRDAYAEIRLHKYKRCIRIISDIRKAMGEAFMVGPEYINWLNKWRDRWIRIANKFKEER